MDKKVKKALVKRLRLGGSRNEIAAEFGIAFQSVHYLSEKYGLCDRVEYNVTPAGPPQQGPWSQEDMDELKRRVDMGFLAYEIGHLLGRSEKAVHIKIHRLKLSTPENVLLRKREANKGRLIDAGVKRRMSRGGRKGMMREKNRFALKERMERDPGAREAHTRAMRLAYRGFEVPPDREAEYKALQAKKFKTAEIKGLMGL